MFGILLLIFVFYFYYLFVVFLISSICLLIDSIMIVRRHLSDGFFYLHILGRYQEVLLLAKHHFLQLLCLPQVFCGHLQQ